MSRCIVVIGTGRSGTSCIMGVLHRLGVDIGVAPTLQQIQNASWNYEDRRLMNINKQAKGVDLREASKAYQDYVVVRSTSPLWAIKDPRLIRTFPYIRPLLDDYRIIHIFRPFEETVASFVKYFKNRDESWAKSEVDRRMRQEHQLLTDEKGSTLSINYSTFMCSIPEYVDKIHDFVYEDYRVPTQAAVRFVNPALYRNRINNG